MELEFKAFNLKLRHTFTISRESHDIQPSLIVKLSHQGKYGYGEATSNPYYNITVDKMIEDLSALKPLISGITNETPEVFWEIMYPHLKHNMFALCALDLAYNDLYAKLKGKPLYQLWGYDTTQNPMTNYTIGIDTVEKMVAKMKEMPWPIYKVKLGTHEDLEIVQALRAHTDAVFRVDANCGWQVEEALNNAEALKDLGVEFIEQPLKADNWEGQKELYLKSVLPIIADESCQVEADVKRCHNYFHGVNVKLVKCGGLTPARRMLIQARVLGMKTMVGCMTESTIGISAIAHLLPLLDYVDMDGALLLSEDIATGVTISDGVVAYNNTAGIGADLI